MTSDVEQIKERLDIVDVLSTYIKVEKAGINYKSKCPFHSEKTPSFFISPTRQSFYCFGCGEKGDIFSFVEKFEGLDFRGALETLAQRAGVELKNFKKEEKETVDEKEKLFLITEKAAEFYEMRFRENKAAEEYLRKRGLTDTSILKWRLGFAPDGWRNLHDYLTGKGFSKEEMLRAGLIKKVPGEEKYYDTFRNRIMFPISDAAGRVIAFSGRALEKKNPSTSSGQAPKYLNSPETKLFYKSEVLYGLHVAKNYIRKLDYAVLVEGQIDLLMSHQAKVLNAVASSGTALTELHLKKLKKISNKVLVAYDSDEAGEKAAAKAATLALILGMEAKVASFPKGEDPASVAAKNEEEFRAALRNSEHFIDYMLNKAVTENQGRNQTKEVIKNVLPLVALLKSDIEKSQFVKKIALKMRVSEEAVRKDLNKAEEMRSINIEKLEESDRLKERKELNLERLMAGIVFLEESKSTSPKLRKKWQEIAGEEAAEAILDGFNVEKEALVFEAEMMVEEKDTERTAEDILRRMELESLKQKLQKATISLDGDMTEKEGEETKGEIKNIQKRIKELNN